MPEVALALYLLFLLVAFGWRSWLHRRRTGDIGFRGLSRSPNAIARIAGVALAVVLVAFAWLPIGSRLGMLAPIESLDRPAGHVAGLVLAVLGIAITVLAQVQMGDSWRIGVDGAEVTPLIRRGLFGHVRNPIFSGMLCAALGLVLLVPSRPAVTAWLVLAGLIELQVRAVEEPHLLRTHGQAYEDYAREVGRFLPGVGRWP